MVDSAMLEHCVREDLNETAPRMMAVLDPVKLVIENWPEAVAEDVELENHPNHPEMGSRKVTFGRELYIEREDFMIDPPKKYFRLQPGGEVRLKSAYIVKCTGYETDADGRVTLIKCSYDPETKSGEDCRKVKGTLHWVNASDAVEAEARLYEYLITDTNVDKDDFLEKLNPNSLTVRRAFVEPALAHARPGDKFQFMRIGYFCADLTHMADKPVYNRVVELRDSWKG